MDSLLAIKQLMQANNAYNNRPSTTVAPTMFNFGASYTPTRSSIPTHQPLTLNTGNQRISKQQKLEIMDSGRVNMTPNNGRWHNPEALPSSAKPELLEYRGKKIYGFRINAVPMFCLPQLFDVFLKQHVSGLHTLYTKLRRLNIHTLVCTVEQLRSLRAVNAIQVGVNRCKLIGAQGFDDLFSDCVNTNIRPGRPSKRSFKEEKMEEMVDQKANLRKIIKQELMSPRLAKLEKSSVKGELQQSYKLTPVSKIPVMNPAKTVKNYIPTVSRKESVMSESGQSAGLISSSSNSAQLNSGESSSSNESQLLQLLSPENFLLHQMLASAIVANQQQQNQSDNDLAHKQMDCQIPAVPTENQANIIENPNLDESANFLDNTDDDANVDENGLAEALAMLDSPKLVIDESEEKLNESSSEENHVFRSAEANDHQNMSEIEPPRTPDFNLKSVPNVESRDSLMINCDESRKKLKDLILGTLTQAEPKLVERNEPSECDKRISDNYFSRDEESESSEVKIQEEILNPLKSDQGDLNNNTNIFSEEIVEAIESIAENEVAPTVETDLNKDDVIKPSHCSINTTLTESIRELNIGEDTSDNNYDNNNEVKQLVNAVHKVVCRTENQVQEVASKMGKIEEKIEAQNVKLIDFMATLSNEMKAIRSNTNFCFKYFAEKRKADFYSRKYQERRKK